MATSQLASSATEQQHSAPAETSHISQSLKFVVSNLKTLVPNQLSAENYPIWRHQILKLLRANDFDQFLAPPTSSETSSDPTDVFTHKNWRFIDQNLQAAICSTISRPLLPYILHLDTTYEIWQYLTEINKLVDQIASADSTVDTEDIVLYIMNGLPPAYQSFKTYIRNSPQQIRLENLYAMLISEEIYINVDAARNPTDNSQQVALYAQRGRGRRSRDRSNPSSNSSSRPSQSQQQLPTCQICAKKGHMADICWHRMNASYT
ncbi:uncharacterized protein LOC110098649 [Dendrobium catenatum]|uniref:uncharacterized protein LOC110098649 n=1 Tax=Dendrobium catenatum TaxID=906689 RepID=UPI0009F35434|nr:uncharacterized protein LOC110098649 [Dendrobium catenatum]